MTHKIKKSGFIHCFVYSESIASASLTTAGASESGQARVRHTDSASDAVSLVVVYY